MLHCNKHYVQNLIMCSVLIKLCEISTYTLYNNVNVIITKKTANYSKIIFYSKTY